MTLHEKEGRGTHFAAHAAGFACIGLIAFAITPSKAQAIPDDGEYVASPIQENPHELINFWLENDGSRMKAAENSLGFATGPDAPPLLEGADQSGYVALPEPYQDHPLSRITGMLFYLQPESGTPAHCSASVVTSASQNLILTAAHCVMGKNRWKDKMVFVPAYNGTAPIDDGRIPLGIWPVRQAFVTPPPLNVDHPLAEDVAVAALYPEQPFIGPPAPIEVVVGGGLIPRISPPEGESFGMVKILGYPGISVPGDPSYEGTLRRCNSPAFPDERSPTSGIGLKVMHCAMQSGNSGGPFVIGQSNVLAPEVIAVVHDKSFGSPLKAATFGVLYEAADHAALSR
jgi:hypothetical protein